MLYETKQNIKVHSLNQSSIAVRCKDLQQKQQQKSLPQSRSFDFIERKNCMESLNYIHRKIFDNKKKSKKQCVACDIKAINNIKNALDTGSRKKT